MTISPGTRLGPYEVLTPIGAGGMGEVFRAKDTRLDRIVAIKVLSSHLSSNPQLRERFDREARAVSALNHPNICTLHDVGHEDGIDYIVMELLEGDSLADLLVKGPLPIEQVLRYGVQIAEGLAKAHRQGIVHRDLKPGNVMITKSGAKLLDFGLAKNLTEVSAMSGTTNLPTAQKPLTQEGMILGTFQYMAPEQLEGEEADARTDIFAFGVLLYEMTTGKRAFQGKTRTSLIAAIVSSEPPPIAQIQPLTPPALEHVIRKCLVKDRDDRWQSAHDIAEELKWISEAGSQAGVAAPLIARKKSRERLWWTAAVIAALIGGIFTARTLRLGPGDEGYRFSIPTVGEGFRSSRQRLFTISPDGRRIVFEAIDESGTRSLRLRAFDEFSSKKLEGSEDLGLGRFSPDGRSLILDTVGGKIVRLPAEGGVPQLVAQLGEGWSTPRSTRSGVVIVLGPDARFYRVTGSNASPEPITVLDRSRNEIAHQNPVMLLDDRFLFNSRRRDPNARGFTSDLYIGSVDGKAPKRIGETTSQAHYVHGHIYFVREGTLMAAPFDLKKLAFFGEAKPVVDGVRYDKLESFAYFVVAENGTIVYLPPPAGAQMVWFDLAGRALGKVGKKGDIFWMRIASDGSVVYTDRSDPRDGVRHLWSNGLMRDTTTRLSFDWAQESHPLISRDGQQLYYSADRGDYDDIYVKPADGSEEGKLLIREPFDQIPMDVSSNGRYLLYSTEKNWPTTRNDLWAVSLASDAKPFPVVRTPGMDRRARLSPDGTAISYSSDVSGTEHVYVKPFPAQGGARQVSLSGGTWPRWSPDGRSLYFVSGQRIMVADASGATEPRVLFDAGTHVINFDVAPDGQRLLLAIASDEDLSPPLHVIVGWRPPKS